MTPEISAVLASIGSGAVSVAVLVLLAFVAVYAVKFIAKGLTTGSLL